MPHQKLLLLLVASLCTSLQAADPPPFKKPSTSFECRWTDEPVVVDGKMDEKAWKHAEVLDRFHLPWLGDKTRDAKTATRARLLWDRANLYFFAEMDDTDLYADVKQHDGETWNNDVFELFFKPADDKPGYFEFQVNAAGTVFDMFVPQRGSGGFERFAKDVAFHLETKVTLKGSLNKWTDGDQGWSVEGRIPWTDFLRAGGRPDVGESWKFALCRYDYSVDFEGPELSTVAPLTIRDFHHFEDYATLKFVGSKPDQVSKKFGIGRRDPLVTSKVVGAPDPPPPYRAVKAYPQLKLDYPFTLAKQPLSDRMFVVGQMWPFGPAKLYRFRDAPDVSELEEIMDFGRDGMAYGFAFHPKYAENGYVYIGFNNSVGRGPKQTRVVRYTIDRRPPYQFDVASAKEIIAWDSDGHNGGDLAFGLDGMLFITSGDGTSDSDGNLTGQDLTKLHCKMLRIDVDHPDADRAYSVPKDNPFLKRPNVRPETWAYGFRNPWRMTVDEKTGHVWVGNNGQDLWEQVYFVRPGENYGWSVYEGSHLFYAERKLAADPLTLPAAEHHHTESRSLTGGHVYYGKEHAELQGAYIYGDYATGRVWSLRHDGKKPFDGRLIADTSLSIAGFATDHAGELLVLDHRGQKEGGIYRLERTPIEKNPPRFPRKLSESGLFESVREHRPAPGIVPYSVNSPLWSDNAYKERFIAVPHKPEKDQRIEVTGGGGWNFPDETVLIKSFALEMEQGNPASRRWIETRFLTRQQGEWAGYSYRWNDDQTDAELVANEGADREFTIQSSDGMKKQTWHYPSRTECMVCHSRAANWILGVTTLQFNRDHDYGGVIDNQMRVLEHLGMLRVNYRDEIHGILRDELRSQEFTEKEVNERFGPIVATRLQREAKQSSLLSQPPAKYPRLPNPYDDKAELTSRVRSYFHVNCASCHLFAGGGNSQIQLTYDTQLDKTKLLDAVPVHHKYNLPDARIIAPGAPERSVLLHRLGLRGPGQMPQLATNVVDDQAVALVRRWIEGLKPEEKDVKPIEPAE